MHHLDMAQHVRVTMLKWQHYRLHGYGFIVWLFLDHHMNWHHLFWGHYKNAAIDLAVDGAKHTAIIIIMFTAFNTHEAATTMTQYHTYKDIN